ncbi:MAG: SLBB domain-containing protein [Kouleothrix sp.]|nr:SLBB domain-containing protein [Kouleothrix sp.]
MNPDEHADIAAREHKHLRRFSHHIGVCASSSCLTAGRQAVADALEHTIKERGLHARCHVGSVGCQGLCAVGPLVAVTAGSPLDDVAPTLYHKVTPDDAAGIVDRLDGPPVEHLVLASDLPFFVRQRKVVLEHAGKINPERIESYIAAGGYAALLQALTTMTPQEVIGEVTRSGLRGRGGAGYSTGLKWTTVSKADGPRKFVICNADEGDPGAYMDRQIVESDPHRLLEGMALAGYAVGASTGYIYIRNAYALAIKRMRAAIHQARKVGLLGQQIGDTTFNFDVELRIGAGAFVCGEETALIAAIEGRRGVPSPRPPYPADQGLWGAPTLINNVETIANIPPIVRSGGAWFAGIGLPHCTGTKVFALAGDVAHTGLVEVPMGTTLRELIFEIGDGIADGHSFKAVQLGGPSGGCIAADGLDMSIDYDSLVAAGTFMGSGGVVVLNERTSMVEVARYFMGFCKEESCGKCIPCRVGTAQMYDLLSAIVAGTASLADLALLERLCSLVRRTSLCGLGQSAPNPVLSTLHSFRHEYLALLQSNDGPAH